ncbi:MAG: hypothetical protein L6Q66_11070 [Bacteroidia bacterium]|nr:hypothetical protein [Bacteroidia bacterium]
MPHITKIIDSAQIHTREFKQLRDMVIDLHFQNQPINPLYIAALVAVINIFGLWLIFKLNKKKELHILETNIKKEINIEVAKLYGKFKAMSLSYINIFYQYDGANATYNYYCFLKNYFTSCSRDADYMSSMDAEDINNFYERLNDILKKESSTLKTSNEKFEDFKNKKVALFEVLHQISFYYKDDKLNKMINDVQT